MMSESLRSIRDSDGVLLRVFKLVLRTIWSIVCCPLALTTIRTVVPLVQCRLYYSTTSSSTTVEWKPTLQLNCQ